MDLNDLMGEIQAERASAPVSPRQSSRYTWPDLRPVTEPQWKPEDKELRHQLALSNYDLYWLYWRLVVHLRSYEQYEWSEMKDALNSIVQRLEVLKNGSTQTNQTERPEVSQASEL